MVMIMSDKLALTHLISPPPFLRLSVDGELVSEIGHGLMVLVGISRDDVDKDLTYM